MQSHLLALLALEEDLITSKYDLSIRRKAFLDKKAETITSPASEEQHNLITLIEQKIEDIDTQIMYLQHQMHEVDARKTQEGIGDVVSTGTVTFLEKIERKKRRLDSRTFASSASYSVTPSSISSASLITKKR